MKTKEEKVGKMRRVVHEIAKSVATARREYYYFDDVCGFEASFTPNDEGRNTARLSLYDRGNRSGRLGLLESYPKSVAQIRALAERVGAVLAEIANELEAAGFDDLRSDSDKLYDSWEEQLTAFQDGK